MEWIIDSDRPVYKQLIEQIELRIVSGLFLPGERLPSVREMASEAAVNPNTMQKALSELERTGLVYAQRTSGRFITEDKKMIKEAKRELAMKEIADFFEKMKRLGFNKQEIIELVAKLEKEER
ncbi:MAG: GntR family transcriptional regulator [Eubacterium sp.]|nr:GntR family transcriptional regulator [Eubacterium sp.]